MISAFDIDGTLLKVNCSFAFSKFLYKKKIFTLKEYLSSIIYYFRYKYFGMPLKELHIKAFKTFFKDKKAQIFFDEIPEFIKTLLPQEIFQPAFDRLTDAKKASHLVLLLSSSPDFLVNPIADYFGCKIWHATEYQINKEGYFCEINAIMLGDLKAKILKKYANKVSKNQLFVYSDSSDDLEFLKTGTPIVVNPDQPLKTIAQKNHWEIIH